MDRKFWQLLEKRNRYLQRWIQVYEEFRSEGEIKEEKVKRIQELCERLNRQLKENYPDLVNDDGSINREKMENRYSEAVRKSEKKRKALLEKVLKKNKDYKQNLAAVKETVEEQRKDVRRRKAMSRQYRGSGSKRSLYLDQKI